jgi:AICAR transformylase/IMP cyclohydrolase PurH
MERKNDLNCLLQTMSYVAAVFDLNRGMVPYIALSVKQGDICGAGVDDHSGVAAIKKMIACDTQSLFNGLIMLNFPVDIEEAEAVLNHNMESKRPLAGLVAPWFSPEALNMRQRQAKKIRFIANSLLSDLNRESWNQDFIFYYDRHKYLLRPDFKHIFNFEDAGLETYGVADETEEDDMLFAKAICDVADNDKIAIVKDGQLLSNSTNQNSLDTSKRSPLKIISRSNIFRAVIASNIPLSLINNLEALVKRGIVAIISISNSSNNQKLIELCQSYGAVVYLAFDIKKQGPIINSG